MAINKPTIPNADEIEARTDEAVGKLQEKIHSVSDQASAALGRVAGQAEDLARRTLDRARDTSAVVKERIGRAGDATVGYIKDEPVKAVVIAAATGAVAALVLSWLARSRSSDRNS
ncbi:DUF883 family protein [Pelomonas sp. KK5]|uniref:DUF883 family protein n=1 Tax=Pelomonas sp. KK5 TaxID=1855730 RepID=UPI00097CBB31|nr:DUF883 family protein [Pelomonas sp. KK5]